MGVEMRQITAYHPQANGLVERWQCSLKARLNDSGATWMDELPWAMLRLRAA